MTYLQRFWRKINWRTVGIEVGLPLFLFTLISLAVSWPLARNFSTKLISNGGDARNNLWQLWHVKEFFLGHQALFDMPLLYYPTGINLLSRGLGPLVGVFALPFWPWGPVAAHNGALLVSLVLTAYGMYLLARGLKFNVGLAYFAALMLLMAPLHLIGLWGHMTKLFLGMIPLVLLAIHHVLDEERSSWWAVATGLAMLVTLLHNGYQFIFAALAIGFFTAAAFLRSPRSQWLFLFQRATMAALSILIFAGPLLWGILHVTQNSGISVDSNNESLLFQPDLLQLILPPSYHWLLSTNIQQFLLDRAVFPSIESAVSLTFVGLFLGGIAFWQQRQRAWPWLLLTVICALLALGPTLSILGRRTFTEYGLPIIMPYAFFTALPGVDFMRVSGRFMLLGYVALSLTATMGLDWLQQRWTRWQKPILALFILLWLLETWPVPWPQVKLSPVPDFYQQIAADTEAYGVLDLPQKNRLEGNYVGYTSHYQMYQMVHSKGLATGYLARVYTVHPTFPCLYPELRQPTDDVWLNGEPATCYDNLRLELAAANFRYVVIHKPQTTGPFRSGMWGEEETARFVSLFFPNEEPLVDDDLVTVYAVEPIPTELQDYRLSFGLYTNWYHREPEFRWAASPAHLRVTVPQASQATLTITPALIFNPDTFSNDNDQGELEVYVDDTYITTVTIYRDQATTIPFALTAGQHDIALALTIGNFVPSEHGSADSRPLSFAIRTIELQVEPVE